MTRGAVHRGRVRSVSYAPDPAFVCAHAAAAAPERVVERGPPGQERRAGPRSTIPLTLCLSSGAGPFTHSVRRSE